MGKTYRRTKSRKREERLRKIIKMKKLEGKYNKYKNGHNVIKHRGNIDE